MNLPIPKDMTEKELSDNIELQEMIEFILLNVLDEDNIQWMSKKEIIETFERYCNE